MVEPTRRTFGKGRTVSCWYALAILLTVFTWLGTGGLLMAQERLPPLAAQRRAITTDDLVRVRDIVGFSVAPNGKRFAILVRQADPFRNSYHQAWFVGDIGGSNLTYICDGGDVRLITLPDGRLDGDLAEGLGQWSPDSRWFAYTALRNGEVQIWRTHFDGTGTRQLTHSDSDVEDFVWTKDGLKIVYSTGEARAQQIGRRKEGLRSGYRIDDFLVLNGIVFPGHPPETSLRREQVRIVLASNGIDRAARRDEASVLSLAKNTEVQLLAGGARMKDAADVVNAERLGSNDVAGVGLIQTSAADRGPYPEMRLAAETSTGRISKCDFALCRGPSLVFRRAWWDATSQSAIFWRRSGVNFMDNGFYVWSPWTNTFRVILESHDAYRGCQRRMSHIYCVRQTRLQPDHVVAIDSSTGAVSVLADVNSELHQMVMPKIERIVWNTPADYAHLGYSDQAFGYIIYPLNFDPRKKYPLIICPYRATGFIRGDGGDEEPMLVYAANGFVVLNTDFPVEWGSTEHDTPVDHARHTMSPSLGFPHMTMLMNSTFAALDVVLKRNFVDPKRIGIGGVSQGVIVPFFMLQHYDRLSAVSAGSTAHSQSLYYMMTEKYRTKTTLGSAQAAFPESSAYWANIDIADHVATIEAPILFQLSDSEALGDARLFRHLDDAGKPYDAFEFPQELHIKWQPAHRLAIYNRNLDWFRFWLQDVEDPNPAKRNQYANWRHLRQLQCRNPRSLRDYCLANSYFASPAR